MSVTQIPDTDFPKVACEPESDSPKVASKASRTRLLSGSWAHSCVVGSILMNTKGVTTVFIFYSTNCPVTRFRLLTVRGN